MTNQRHALRVPGEDALLTHQCGLMHDEVAGSNLIRVGLDRTDPNPENGAPNPSATEIGKLFFVADPAMNCITHIHIKPTMGVSARAEGLQPLSQACLNGRAVRSSASEFVSPGNPGFPGSPGTAAASPAPTPYGCVSALLIGAVAW